MGAHNQMHKRVVAAKHRRLSQDLDEEEARLQDLIARFSPTAIYTETLTDDVPVPTPSNTVDTVTTTPPPPPPPVTTTTPPPPPPTTTPNTSTIETPPPVNPNPNPDVDTDTTTTQVQPTVNSNIVPVVTPPPTRSITTTAAPPSTTNTSSQTFSSIDSSAASSTPSGEPKSTANVGGIIGGIAGGLLGLIVIVFLVRLVMRHKRKSRTEASGFNSNDFRRSAVLMNDPPTHEETVQRGFNPRPPSMIERRLASPAPTFGTQYGAPAPYGTEYGNMDQYGQFQSLAPGQMMNNMSPPPSGNSANPLYPNPAYTQSPFSPIGSPVSAMGQYGSGYDQPAASPYLTRQPSTGTQLSRQNSDGYPAYGSQDGHPGSPQYANYPAPANLSAHPDYVDLDRSSVTPFQAAQYAEISKRLNTEVPGGLDTPGVNQFLQARDGNTPPVPAQGQGASPFADPDSRRSADSTSRDINDFPAPPSPAHTRIDSTPPSLPEIFLESRVASYDFPGSVQGGGLAPSPLASGYPSGLTAAGSGFAQSPLAHQFPATPSPQASSFGINTPPAAATSFPAAATATPAHAAAVGAEMKRPDTIYDDDDPYGGI